MFFLFRFCHAAVSMVTTAPVSIENMTIQNGKTPNSLGSSAIYLTGFLGMSHLDVTNCILKNNKTGAAINAGPGSGNIRIRKSQFIGNQATAIEVFAVSSLLVEDTTVANNSGNGIYVNNETSNVTIRRSTISNNALIGIAFHRCSSCLIENATVSQNQQDGVRIYAFSANPNYDMIINYSTFFGNGNGFAWAGNIKLEFFDSTNKLFLNNSILSMNNVSKPNCLWNTGNPDSHGIIATNSIIDDSACEQIGSGNIIGNPLLGPLANNGGLTSTRLPLAGSPAIDAGTNNLCSSEDQRGLPRPIDKLGAGPRCDIGAVEQQ